METRLFFVKSVFSPEKCISLSKVLIMMAPLSGGLFTIGFACENSITFDFEVTIGPESHRIPFKFLMNRRID